VFMPLLPFRPLLVFVLTLLDPGRQEDTTPTRQTQTALRRNPAPPNNTNTSPRSPLTSVRNIVAAWKERTPGIGKVKSESSEGEMSPPVVPKASLSLHVGVYAC
jgi:hypothetical protein